MIQQFINIEDKKSLTVLFDAIEFAAFKHRLQKRKGTLGIPYINHPIEVAGLLIRQMDNLKIDILVAALLHDTIEDTETTFPEITEKFGVRVAEIVLEVTDDMTLPSKMRKQIQIDKASTLTYEARCIKIADKSCNVRDIVHTRMVWTKKQKLKYIRWAIEVVEKMQGTDKSLEDDFYLAVNEAETLLETKVK